MITVVVGGQFGSEGKGGVAAMLAERGRAQVTVRVAGPNAGHTAVGKLDGKKWALRQIPATAVVNLESELVIAAGSEIEREVLDREIQELDAAGYAVSDRLWVDAEATMIDPEHQEAEATAGLERKSGTTGKGIGAARAARLMREARRACEEWESGWLADTAKLLRKRVREGRNVLVEGTQGFGLGLRAGYYPHCTSSDCRAIDFLAMCGLSPWQDGGVEVEPWVVLRTYPIRIAGNSGPLLGEMSWEEVGQPPEKTTVTQKVRRVGSWDPWLARKAIEANGGPVAVKVALTFFDYWFPELAGKDGVLPLNWIGDEAAEKVRKVQEEIGAEIAVLGTGPNTYIRIRGDI